MPSAPRIAKRMKPEKPTLPPTQAPSSPEAHRPDPETASLRRRVRELSEQVQALEREIEGMRQSSSWRLSAPLRRLSGWLGGGNADAAHRPADRADYVEWVRRYDSAASEAPAADGARLGRPRFSVLVEVRAEAAPAQAAALAATLGSLQAQAFGGWEAIVIAAAPDIESLRSGLPPELRSAPALRWARAGDGAESAPAGDWLLWLSPGDLLATGALCQFSDAIDARPGLRLLYADHDLLDAAGRRTAPRFLPDWNPELFHAEDLVSMAAVFERSLVAEAGGRPVGAAAGYDLVLRCAEALKPAQIGHLPRVLVHLGSVAASPDRPQAETRALARHFERTGIAADIRNTAWGRHVRYRLPPEPPLASLIIPTRNGLELLRQCVGSLIGRTLYARFEILIVDNSSDDPATLAYLDELRGQPGFTVIRDDRPFNFSALNNLAARSARGEVLGLLNNDIEVITPGWLDEMVSLALQPGIGAVGAKLLYPDESIQHSGVLLGVGGIAGHAHKHLPASEPGYMNRAMLTQSFSAVTAACLVVRKQLYEQVGGLDEVELKIAYNDVDFCLRLAEAGHRTVWTPHAELFHHESATRGSDMTPEKRERFEREQACMRARWGSLIAADPAYNPNLTLDAEDFGLAWPPRVPWVRGASA